MGVSLIARLPKERLVRKCVPPSENAPADPMKIHTVQAIRKIVFYVVVVAGVFVVAVTSSITPSGTTAHELIEWIGIVLIVVCILGRTWSSLYIGGRKIEEFVQTGPYSIMRNPLYFFSCLGAVGVGMQVGTVVLGLVCGLLAYVVFYLVILREEELLTERYGATYRSLSRAGAALLSQSVAVARRRDADDPAAAGADDLRRRAGVPAGGAGGGILRISAGYRRDPGIAAAAVTRLSCARRSRPRRRPSQDRRCG